MAESELLTRSECQELFDRALKSARALGAEEVEVTFDASSGGLTRFANNAIHQNVAEQSRVLSVRTVLDRRTARASTNRFDDASIHGAVEQAIALTRAQEPNPDLLPLPDAVEYRDIDRYCPSTAAITPRERAEIVRDAIEIAARRTQQAAGIYATHESVEALINSRGMFGYHFDTLSQFSITAMCDDSSGWAKSSAADASELDPLGLARRASEKAERARKPRELPPGAYTVILEPSAVQDLVGQMFYDFSATAIEDQRSFLTGRIGKQLFTSGINIADDVYHPLQSGAPFDGEGVPRRRLALVEDGVPREIAYCREAAHRQKTEPTGHGFPVPNEVGEAPVNIVIEGGSTQLDEMIASTKRGVLVTRFWYIREVDPFEKIMTGMTRDGTFLIENGEIVCGLRNFRFNQSLIGLLSNVEAMSPAERTSGEEVFDMVAPAMKVHDFHFTEVTKF